jgi:hypothetical protein
MLLKVAVIHSGDLVSQSEQNRRPNTPRIFSSTLNYFKALGCNFSRY